MSGSASGFCASEGYRVDVPMQPHRIGCRRGGPMKKPSPSLAMPRRSQVPLRGAGGVVSGELEAEGGQKVVRVVVPEHVGGREDDGGENRSEKLAAAAQRVSDQRGHERQCDQEAEGLKRKGSQIERHGVLLSDGLCRVHELSTLNPLPAMSSTMSVALSRHTRTALRVRQKSSSGHKRLIDDADCVGT